ncbi:interactor of constitutive active ROPs 1-like isoform X2 [Phalaenopsis equestris]|uniref:interactor of constitutive active ROPs 1-like isoform X2 n=1 Tax=Phalaenopsis equestris TaxID=78828 RepID=UPI0009E1FCBB|nr:interactor of constitutive active ROPs 1-like isoform X2 [Phalaenopsis equestris]
MPKSRGSEMPQQRQSPRAPLHLKPTASSEAISIRSPKLEDRRSPRSPVQERKKGSRIADLERKLDQAQEELEKVKEQLASAEAARIDAVKELEVTKKHFPVSPLKSAALDPADEEKEKTINVEEEKVDLGEVLMEKGEPLRAEEDSVNCKTTDVFEVAPASSEGEGSGLEEEDAVGTKTKVIAEEEKVKEEMKALEKEMQNEDMVESLELIELKAILVEKEKQLEIVVAENHALIKEAENVKVESLQWREKAEEVTTKLSEAEEELKKTKMASERQREKFESDATAKASMEAEMKRLRVQTDQWRKAAEAAAAVLVAGDGLVNDGELKGRGLGESGRSMEKHLRGYGGGGWSPVIAGGEGEEVDGGGKRRGSGGGIRVFGELWKKKSQLK